METILIVDDEQDIREMLSEWLRAWGYRPLEAEDGPEALHILRQEHVDLVLSDLRMPQMNGVELLSRIKEIKPETSVLILTGFGTVENAVEALKLGADDYVLKPFDLEDLQRKITLALNEQQKRDRYPLVRTLNWALIVSIPIWLILAILLVQSFSR